MNFGQSRAVLLGALFLLTPSLSHAADPAPKGADPKKAEAAERFDRGLTLFDDGDNSGALAEFKRTYELMPNPVVLYNIGLVYAAMGRPVDAVDALEPVVAGGSLSPTQLERAKKTLAEQKARIGRLAVTTTPPEGARIEIDNVEVAKTPLTAPIRIAEGSHIVGAVAEGFAPARKEVVVAGNADASLHLDLVPTQGKRLANLSVRTSTVGAEVRVDNETVGKTPLATSLTLVAGHHQVELRRPGYTSAKREVDVGEGATGELEFDLAVDPAALGREGATLVLDASEPGADLTVDGDHKGPYTAPLRLPRGPHHLSITAAGFLPTERDVNLDSSSSNVVHVELEPTPEKRAAYESSAYGHRTWGWVLVGSGAAVGAAGGVYLAINAPKKQEALDELNTASDNAANRTGPPVCHTNTATGDAAACNQIVADAQANYDSIKSRDIIGYIGIGVGAAAFVTGIVVLVTGDDPHRYDRPSHDLGASTKPRFALTPGPGQVGTGFAVSF
jgi:hypothetical protein